MGDVQLAAELRERGIHNERVLKAIASLNRSDFLPEELAREATGDYPLPIGFGQTISQPFIVAFMTQSLALEGNERALEIGTGSGYQTALLALLCREVFSIEIVPALAKEARERLSRLGFTNVHVREGDGRRGWPEEAPFEAILATAAPERIPEELIPQLALGGRFVTPVGPQVDGQELVLIEKELDGRHTMTHLLPVRFVPMTSAQPSA